MTIFYKEGKFINMMHLIISDHLSLTFLADFRLVNVFDNYPLPWVIFAIEIPWRFRGLTFLLKPLCLSSFPNFIGLLDKLCFVFIRLVSLICNGDLDFLPFPLYVWISDLLLFYEIWSLWKIFLEFSWCKVWPITKILFFFFITTF